MLDLDQFRLTLLEAEVTNKILNKNIDINQLNEFLELSGATNCQQKLDIFFNILYNKFIDADIVSDFDYLIQIFIGLVDDSENLNIISEEPNKTRIAEAYAKFLNFLNVDFNNTDLEIQAKLDKLADIDRSYFFKDSEVRRLYLFFTMNIALAQPLNNMELLNNYAKELEELLNK